MATTEIFFYKFLVTKQVFFKSRHTYALVNLKPLVPGHVLVVPLRTSILRFADLTPEESIDYMNTLQLVHRFVKHIYRADALNIAIQDGPELGQSVPHLHTHIIPRCKTDGYGDSIYTKLEVEDLESQYEEFFARKKAYREKYEDAVDKELAKSDSDRVPRTEETMEKEANWLAQELEKFRAVEGAL
ncbi:Bis(5'-adenosyl)-triphosphatase [Candida viswanathii]|uniref:Bis(5'-adenosyl)-triphosphatase n=1 Tax=Candida viswanathii TaxID=5486 RepID=A0A367XX32_9ASCO|nr:Bis(5'-adenosyl)-triphosphatase [Candida viswanathii]